MFVQEGNVREKGDKVRNWFLFVFVFLVLFSKRKKVKPFTGYLC